MEGCVNELRLSAPIPEGAMCYNCLTVASQPTFAHIYYIFVPQQPYSSKAPPAVYVLEDTLPPGPGADHKGCMADSAWCMANHRGCMADSAWCMTFCHLVYG